MELGNINENLIEKDICIICFEPINTSLETKNINITCKCNVQYHNTCLEQWFSRSPTCPICHTLIRHKYKCSHKFRSCIKKIITNPAPILCLISLYGCLFIFFYWISTW